MPAPERAPRTLSRLAWFVVLYVGSLGLFTAVVYGLRALVSR
jgi:hypothetical protein